jgi:hypothetical protein
VPDRDRHLDVRPGEVVEDEAADDQAPVGHADRREGRGDVRPGHAADDRRDLLRRGGRPGCASDDAAGLIEDVEDRQLAVEVRGGVEDEMLIETAAAIW